MFSTEDLKTAIGATVIARRNAAARLREAGNPRDPFRALPGMEQQFFEAAQSVRSYDLVLNLLEREVKREARKRAGRTAQSAAVFLITVGLIILATLGFAAALLLKSPSRASEVRMNKDVKYLTPKRSVKEIHGTERRAASAQAVAELMFVKAAQEQQLDETTIAEYPDLFVEWDANWRGKQGDIVQDEGNLYRSIHDVTNEGQNTKPSATPSMWTRIGNPLDEFPEWVQPIGAHDAYAKGDKASHNGKNWVSTADNNVWEPGVYGWEEATQATAVAADEGDGE